jgi:DNA polymerase, archaea type
MQLGITQIDFSNTSSGGAVLHIFGRDKDAKAHRVDLTGFVPYYFIPKEQADIMKHPSVMEIDKTRIYKSIYGDELRRVECKNSPIDIHVTKNLYQHFEADIPFHVRYMIDNHITSGIETDSDLCDYRLVKACTVKTPARVCFLDIECSDEKGFPEPERDPITAITMYDNFDKKYTTLILNMTGKPLTIQDPPNRKTIIFDDEKKLLKAFCDYIRQKDPDILSGWNVQDFDMDYIVRRMSVFGMSIELISRLPPNYGDKRNKTNVRGRNTFDLLSAYKKITTASGKRESYRLDAIAEYELKEHKIHFDGSVNQLARDDPQKFVEYNYKDVELCVGIDKKSHIIDFYRELAGFVGCPLDKTLDSSSVVDVYVLRKAHDKGFVLPSKGYSSDEKFEGATVFSPSKGVEENVIVLDLKSLYPMCMITMNASPETKNPKGELHSPNGIHFSKEPIGLVREIILELLDKRDALKKEMKNHPKGSPEYDLLDQQQNVLKIIMNTYYGVSGYARFRLYDNEIAAAVTAAGRAIIEYTRQYIESKGYSVKYGDTDSSFVKIHGVTDPEEVKKLAFELEKELNALYPKFAKDTLNADVSFFSTKFEKYYRRFFQGGKKKRYAGHIIWKEGQTRDDIDVVGFETKRSDSPRLARDVMEKILEMILRGSTKEEIRVYLSDVIKKYRKGEYPYDLIGIPGGIGKNLEDYDIADAHVRGCKYANEHLGAQFLRGSKPKRLYIKSVSSKYPQTDVICFEYGEQVPKEFNIDYETMFDKTIKSPLERIFEPLGWTFSEFDPQKTTLSMFGIN